MVPYTCPATDRSCPCRLSDQAICRIAIRWFYGKGGIFRGPDHERRPPRAGRRAPVIPRRRGLQSGGPDRIIRRDSGATTNDGFEKKQREQRNQKKNEEKAERRGLEEAANSAPAGAKRRMRTRPNRDHAIATDRGADLDRELNARINALCEEGRAFWHRFDAEVRQDQWHPFVAADYDAVRAALVSLRKPGRRFLEWGSATGVITIMADLLGFESFGIELDSSLVEVGREFASRWRSDARFAAGSFIPMGWEWRPPGRNGRHGTIGQGPSGYLKLGRGLDDFDVVYGFPWMGEEPMMLDLMRCHGREDAHLLLHTPQNGTRMYQGGRIV